MLRFGIPLSSSWSQEEHLTKLFGEPYRAYLAEVPRFFPNPLLYKDLEAVSVRPETLYRTFGDGLIFLAAYPFFELVEHLQDAGAFFAGAACSTCI